VIEGNESQTERGGGADEGSDEVNEEVQSHFDDWGQDDDQGFDEQLMEER
jgi:hypothetical protein